eukprot:jgi/Picsp_1/2020/NSC_05486-R1_protein
MNSSHAREHPRRDSQYAREDTGNRKGRESYYRSRYDDGEDEDRGYRRRRPSPSYDARESMRDQGGPRRREGGFRRGGKWNGRYCDQVSDDDIVAESRQDFRRLKRIKMRRRNVGCIWENTPSPPPGEHISDYDSTDDEEINRILALQEKEKNGIVDGDDKQMGVVGNHKDYEMIEKLLQDDKVMNELEQMQVDLFRVWLDAKIELEKAEEEKRRLQEEEDKMVGPEPPAQGLAGYQADYGTHLRPGEGSAMAAYVQQGQRIPRRGEVGLEADEIETFEKIGYVMSGNRNAKMNAVRIRKENQVYTAEEKAALAMFNFEENKRKESQILEDMKKLVENTIGEAGKK